MTPPHWRVADQAVRRAAMALDARLADELDLPGEPGPVELVALQPAAILDHVCSVDADTLKHAIRDEPGGSRRVDATEIQRLLGGPISAP